VRILVSDDKIGRVRSTKIEQAHASLQAENRWLRDLLERHGISTDLLLAAFSVSEKIRLFAASFAAGRMSMPSGGNGQMDVKAIGPIPSATGTLTMLPGQKAEIVLIGKPYSTSFWTIRPCERICKENSPSAFTRA
jgi:hypothetical protein